MNREEIIRMAREAGIVVTGEAIWKLCELVAAAEREACAKAADETVCDTHLPTGVRIYGTRAAKAIRARGEK